MPLSEDEERILHEIAQQFYADDPEFAREVGETTLYTHTVRRMKWSGFGFAAGVVFLIATLSTSYLLAFVGFLAMLACALYFERNLRKLGKAGLRSGHPLHPRHGPARRDRRRTRSDARAVPQRRRGVGSPFTRGRCCRPAPAPVRGHPAR